MKLAEIFKTYKKYIVPSAAVLAALTFALFLPAREAIIRIDSGTTPKQAAKLLKKEKLIVSENVFLALARLTGTEKKFQTGIYRFRGGGLGIRILRDIVRGNSYRVKVTVPEGYTAEETARLLEKKGILNAGRFMALVKEKKLEGYLYPETYFFTPESSEEYAARMMTSEFAKKYTQAFRDRAKGLGMTEAQVVTLASIIEKEAKEDSERPVISAVFHNRLRKGWHLESCATVMYALGSRKTRLTLKDTKIKSPFNTYIRPGLPPAPICSPGLASIKAALYPAETGDMFFVADGSGTHKFSKYLEEHNRQKMESKKSMRARR